MFRAVIVALVALGVAIVVLVLINSCRSHIAENITAYVNNPLNPDILGYVALIAVVIIVGVIIIVGLLYKPKSTK